MKEDLYEIKDELIELHEIMMNYYEPTCNPCNIDVYDLKYVLNLKRINYGTMHVLMKYMKHF